MDGNLGPRLETLMNFKIHQGMRKLLGTKKKYTLFLSSDLYVFAHKVFDLGFARGTLLHDGRIIS